MGGFAVAAVTSILAAVMLTRTGAQPMAVAVQSATVPSWLIWAIVAMWCFHAPSTIRLVLTLSLSMGAMAVIAWNVGFVISP